MLGPVEPINIEIMDDQEKQDLQRHRPARDQLQSRQMPMMVDRENDPLKDHDLQKIALNKGIPYQVYPKPLAEYRYPLGIWKKPFQPDKHNCTCNQQTSGNNYNFIHHVMILLKRPAPQHGFFSIASWLPSRFRIPALPHRPSPFLRRGCPEPTSAFPAAQHLQHDPIPTL